MDTTFETHYLRLVATARRVLGDHALAEEVAADALHRLEGDPVARRPDDEVRAWLYRVTVRLALNRLRHEQRHRARLVRHGSTTAGTGTVDPGDAVVADDQRTRVRDVLARLPERQATALLLRHAGHTHAEVAAALGVAEGSVGVLLARGERAFTRLWDDDDPGQPDPSRPDHDHPDRRPTTTT